MINNLYESVKNITEETLPQKLEKLGLDEQVAADIVKDLSFNEYVSLANAIDNEDTAKIKTFIGEAILPDTEEEEVSKVSPSEITTTNKATGATTTTPTGDDSKTRFTQPDANKKASVTDTGELASADTGDLEVGDDIFTSTIDEDLQRIRELAGLQEAGPEYDTEIEVDGQDVPVIIDYDYEAPEAAIHSGSSMGPGSDEEIYINSVTGLDGQDYDVDLLGGDNVYHLENYIRDRVEAAAEEEYYGRGDYDMERQREKNYHEALEVDETATAGGTGAGGIASAPTVTGETRRRNSHPGTVVGSDKYTGY